MAKDRNVHVNSILASKDMKQLCLSLPIKKDELLSIADSRIIRMNFNKLLLIMKTARKKYFKDPKVDGKYDLKPVPSDKKAVAKTSPKSVQNSPASTKGDNKRKSDGFARPVPAKKGR